MPLPRPLLDLLAPAVLPSDAALFAWLRAHVSRRMIQEIATLDYRHHFERNWHSMEALLYGDEPTAPLQYVPLEVLQLAHWGEPENRLRTSCWSGEPAQIKRLLACALLLRGLVHSAPGGFDLESANSVPIQLTRSAVVLGGGLISATLSALLRFDQQQQHPEVSPFLALCVLLLLIRGGLHKPGGNELLLTVEWVLTEEQAARAALGRRIQSPDWLWGLTAYNARLPALQRLAQQVLRGTNQLAPEVVEAVEQLSTQVPQSSLSPS